MKAHKKMAEHAHTANALHLHGAKGEEIAINPLSRSFWVGMLHGLAGTGGACAMALVLASEDSRMAMGVILLQSLGILLAMTSYSCVLAFSVSRFIERNQKSMKVINALVGVFSIVVGFIWVVKSVF